MNHSIKICLLLLLGIFNCSQAFGQRSTWVEDSLSIYEKTFWIQVKAKEVDEAKETLTYIENQGIEDLDPKIFDFYKRTIDSEEEIPYPQLLASLHSGLGVLEFYRGNINGSKEAFKNAKEFFSKADMTKQVAGMVMNIGIMLEKEGHYDSAVLNYQEALPIFEKYEDTPSLANVKENIGLAYFRQSQLQTALDYFMETESLLNSYLDSLENRWIGFYMNKYMVLNDMNRHEVGLQVLFKALRIAEHNENQLVIAQINMKLADVYDFKGEKEKQYKALMASSAYLKDSKNLSTVASLDYSLLRYHFGAANLDSAIFYAEKSLEFYEPNGYMKEVGNIYGMLGNVEFEKENYREAILYFQRALEKFTDQNTVQYAGYLFNIGYAYNKLGDYRPALESIERSLAIRKELKQLTGIQESYQGLAETYQGMGDYKNAFDNLTLYQTYSDSVFNETKNRQLTELETQYETEKKDQTITALETEKELQNLRSQKQEAQIYMSISGLVVLLGLSGLFFSQAKSRKKYNKELEIKNLEIAKQNAERELLLKEIHHRVKNNLQIISSLLSMQTRSLKDAKMIDAMKESQSRVKTMALIHEKLYQYENLSKINMQEYMQQLSDFLTQTYRSEKQIVINIAAQDINLDMDTAIPLGLITNELLSNSLKYAFEDSDFGEINIIFSEKEPGTYKLQVKDTGKGLDANLDIDNTKSLGLKLVRTLTRQINGQLKIISHPGATFEIDFREQEIAA
ncbi:tetratricopeptide repeat protein [Mongoliibacter ruber]|uniref:Two-component sensor histidine kinase n=1 Tax=Mongoliibacter ruber TaxID=1750599 RepID=A0A2T0WC95_9BACT|nr:tetratricopeptide repeat protein [Mongoliibacter ruber]PRY84318.1 two-component sensor histidine kinase [Mongoliibacter ruber]